MISTFKSKQILAKTLWRPSFQPVSRGATIVFQLDRFTRIIASSPFVVYCQKSIHRCYHNERLILIDFESSLSCHVGSRKRKTDYYLSLRNMKKKSCQKKTIITIDGVNRIPNIPPIKASDDWYNRPQPE